MLQSILCARLFLRLKDTFGDNSLISTQRTLSFHALAGGGGDGFGQESRFGRSSRQRGVDASSGYGNSTDIDIELVPIQVREYLHYTVYAKIHADII